ncbi:MAG: DNA-binding protein [Methylococcaceae bacterium]|nr:MAG: DNA-binding protein [Methylococcaceae bacterium]
MSKPQNTLTPDQFRAARYAEGETITAWANKNGLDPRKVILVLNGQLKGCFGESHKIAVAMGLKPAPGGDQRQLAA